jgi:general secretion pathway protein G
MIERIENRTARRRAEAGLTLIELIIVVTILSVLATAAIPVVKLQVKRARETALRRDLWEMRRAIDAYKDAADKGAFQTKADSMNYPPDLQTLVDGVDVQTKHLRFLRKIPVDPGRCGFGLVGRAECVRRAYEEHGDSAGWDEVLDVVREVLG